MNYCAQFSFQRLTNIYIYIFKKRAIIKWSLNSYLYSHNCNLVNHKKYDKNPTRYRMMYALPIILFCYGNGRSKHSAGAAKKHFDMISVEQFTRNIRLED
jgi:hypothetical protein